MTKKEARAHQKKQGLRWGTWSRAAHWPLRCPPCTEAEERRQEERRAEWERERRERVEARRRREKELAEWAAAALADDWMVVLDTETTGLDDEACIVELTVTDRRGRAIVDTLVNPGVPIPETATQIHGITDEMVASAPTFWQILASLESSLAGRRCLIYGADFDKGRLRWELTRHFRAVGHEDPQSAAAAWLAERTFEDVMGRYAEWFGEWTDCYGYLWQPLGGDHRGLSDCRAVLNCLRAMSRDTTQSV